MNAAIMAQSGKAIQGACREAGAKADAGCDAVLLELPILSEGRPL